MQIRNIYNNLIESLKLVASPSDIQIASLPDFVDVTDEIALIYNESYLMVPQLTNIISPYIISELDNLNKLFDKMSEDQSIWNNNSFENNNLWMESRKLGRSILDELKEKYSPPNLDFIKWIK